MADKINKKIGIMGGTFDPIHKGHVDFADHAGKELRLDKVIFIPTGNPPHKITRLVTSPVKRFEMAQTAVRGHEGFCVSDCEIKRQGETFTYDTLLSVKEEYPEAEIYYLIGSDTLLTLDKWHEKEKVFKMCIFYCAIRKGDSREEVEKEKKRLEEMGAAIIISEYEAVNVSSTALREDLEASGCGLGLLPSGVLEFIRENKLYEKKTFPLSDDDIQRDLKDLLKPERYRHCLGVMEEAVRIGETVGADIVKCRTAGLLHDCAKNLSPEQISWIRGNIKTVCREEDKYEGYNNRLDHASLGVVIARERYGIQDEEILDAIRNHITGRPEMSLLSCVIFLADFTEKGRSGEKFEKARRIFEEEGLYPAMLWECDCTIGKVIKKGEILNADTVRTRNWLISLSENNGYLKDR